jgi:hypothetical protein
MSERTAHPFTILAPILARGRANGGTADAFRPTVVAMLALVLMTGRGVCHGHEGGHGGWRHGGPDWEDEGHSYDRARRASAQGEILSLAEIYRRAATRFPGRVLEAELESEHGRWVYELKILDHAGRLRKVYLDAGSGEFLKSEDDD